jgi:hypothetical protein
MVLLRVLCAPDADDMAEVMAVSVKAMEISFAKPCRCSAPYNRRHPSSDFEKVPFKLRESNQHHG